MITQNLIPQQLMTFEYYANKLPLYLRNSKSFMEHFRIWYDVLGKQGEAKQVSTAYHITFNDDTLQNRDIELVGADYDTFKNINFYGNSQILDAISQVNNYYNLKCNKFAIALDSIEITATESSSKIQGKVFLFQDNTLALNMFTQQNCQTVTINANVETDSNAMSEAWRALIVNALLNQINDIPSSNHNYYISTYDISTDDSASYLNNLSYARFDATADDIAVLNMQYNRNAAIISDDKLHVLTSYTRINNYDVIFISVVDRGKYNYYASEKVNPNTGIIGNSFLLLNMLNIFSDDYFDFLNLYCDILGSDNRPNILDNIASIFGVSRNIKITYTDYDGDLHTDVALVLSNYELSILIKARIIQNYCNGSLEQVNEYYQSIGLNILVNTDNTIAATANLYLIQEQEQEISNIDKMFLAGLLVIKSMGIEYKPQRLVLTNIMIWDSTDTTIGWDGGNWMS